MNIFFAIIATIGIAALALIVLLYLHSVYWSLRHWSMPIALRKERVQKLYEQSAGFQNLFFVFKCLAWLFIWPFPLWHWIKGLRTHRAIVRNLKKAFPHATIIRTKQGNDITYTIEDTEGENKGERPIAGYLMGKENFIEDEG